ncbi:hypothetical protein [Acinetobacter genomosp. 15BJ]|uniref:Lipoprotein n=1 Tax=Acinetobacter genomosp. 15BJ TaxID=106651 RepID=A0ABT8UZX3_9GAMM|nr:hypothetical protein [Acinetobacter genomosp. 15BJ]MCH7293419.1 hypothetical protein [Acinetobacter genomosp. 15BJ]MDO3658603.1 hypothetical protein [Acinetobacter genomosp. 15BJ]
MNNFNIFGILFVSFLCMSCSNGQSAAQANADTQDFVKKLNPQHRFKVHGCARGVGGGKGKY